MCERQALSRVRPALLQANNSGASSYLLYRQLLQFGQRAGEQSHQERGRAAHDVNHGWGQNRNEGVLPGEGVQQGNHGVRAAREGAGERGTTTLVEVLLCPEHLPPADKLSVLKCKCPRGCPSITSDFRWPRSPSSPYHFCTVQCGSSSCARL